jgi:hypothetical protein
VTIVLWVPSSSAVMSALGVGQKKGLGLGDRDFSGVSEVESSGVRQRGDGNRGTGGYSSTDGASTDGFGGRAGWRGPGGGAGLGGGGGVYGGSLGKIRLHAVLGIHGVARLQPKLFQPFWAQLLPGDLSTPMRRGGETLTLLSILVSDPSPKVRTAVAMALQVIPYTLTSIPATTLPRPEAQPVSRNL